MLITEAMVEDMRPGSVIVDMAVEQGGNCPISQPRQVVREHGVSILGHVNLAGRVANSASAHYARNLFNFLEVLVDPETGALEVDLEDEIVKGTLIVRDGKVVHPALIEEAKNA